MTTTWRKSSYSGAEGGSACIELARIGEAIAIRDSKHPNGPKLLVTRKALKAVLTNHP